MPISPPFSEDITPEWRLMVSRALSNNERIVTEAYTVGAQGKWELYGGVIYVQATCTITAPPVQAGYDFAVIVEGAYTVTMDVDDDDKMCLDGTWLSDGQAAVGTGTSGDIIVLRYHSADGYFAVSGSAVGTKWSAA